MSSILVCLIWFGVDDLIQPIELEEMASASLLSTATHHGKTLVATTRGGGKTDHYLYDHGKGLAWHLEDGRIRNRMLSKIVAMDGGFAILDGIRLRIYFLDQQGRFVKQEDPDQYQAMVSDRKVVRVMPYGLNKVLLSFWPLPSRELSLAIMDLKAKTFQVIYSFVPPRSFRKSFWFQFEKNLFFVVPEKGSIVQVNRNSFKPMKTWLPGTTEYVPNPFFNPRKDQSFTAAKYMPILSNFVQTPTVVKFDIYHYRRDGSLVSKDLALLAGNRVSHGGTEAYSVGKALGSELIFDRETGDFSVVKSQ